MANILSPTIVNIVKGTATPIVSSISYGGGLGNQINLAYSQANTALLLAQDAYNYANTISGGAAGSTYQVQYNGSGAFAANSHFTYDFNQNTLHVDKIDAVIDAGTF